MVTARRPKRPTAQQLEHEVEDLRVSLQIANERLDVAVARQDGALDALKRLVAHVRKVGGYMSPEDQQALRDAEARLVEGR